MTRKKRSTKSSATKSVDPIQVLQCIRGKLQTSAIPDSLPCRENEFSDIHNFVDNKLKQSVGGCMYISGVPGTGKTATVKEVIRSLQDKSKIKRNLVPGFRFIEVNGLRLSDPYQCYSHIYHELTSIKTSSLKSLSFLEDIFSNPNKNKEFIVLLVDELDLLCTKKQNILYNLFEWPNKPFSKLIVIAIANAMDLPERVLMKRVASRLGLTRITFQPYNHQELQQIMMSRLEDLSVIDPDGVQLIARKVSAVSGDARRTLDICRRATEIAQEEYNSSVIKKPLSSIVNMKHVDKALNEMFLSPILIFVSNASTQEQMFLRSVVQEFRMSGLEEAVFIEVYHHHVETCKFEGIYSPTTSELFQIAVHLFECRVILLDDNKILNKRKIRLNCSVDDVNFSLNMKN